MIGDKPHISVCVCTYKRPILLKRLLSHLSGQQTDGHFTYSIVIVDNDKSGSAEAVVRAFSEDSGLAVEYCIEPEQNIALARNRAAESASGHYIAFLDDDEFPINNWLLTLYQTCVKLGCDGVLGPVDPHFDEKCPRWIIKGGICERKCPPTGTIVQFQESRTGNVLLRKKLFHDPDSRFDPRFGRTGGEDKDFFKRAIAKGYSFVWCREAIAYETVPPERWRASYYIKRYVRLGGLAGEQMRKSGGGASNLARALAGVCAYSLLLPISLFLGKHMMVKCLTKGGYHLAWLSGYCGAVPIRFRDD